MSGIKLGETFSLDRLLQIKAMEEPDHGGADLEAHNKSRNAGERGPERDVLKNVKAEEKIP